jgi:DNA-binding phage protein
MVKTERFDAARYLDTREARAEVLNGALASGNAAYVAQALGATPHAEIKPAA